MLQIMKETGQEMSQDVQYVERYINIVDVVLFIHKLIELVSIYMRKMQRTLQYEALIHY